jgi:glycosyltransferase involved in cell wall biosynthesis
MLKKKIILDTHCVNKLLALHFKNQNRLVYFARKILWDLLERFAIKFSDVIIVVSELEGKFIQTEYKAPRTKIFIIPNAIEMKRNYYSEEELSELRKKLRAENKVVVTFVGDLKMIQNKDATQYIVTELAPFFLEEKKNVVFLVIGRGEENFKCTLPNVIFTGFVEELLPYLEISDICIAPYRVGAGVKTKILTYIALGKPILTTPIGVEGVEVYKLDSIVVTDIAHFPNTLQKTLDRLNDLKQKARKNVEIAKSMYAMDITAHLEKVLKALE